MPSTESANSIITCIIVFIILAASYIYMFGRCRGEILKADNDVSHVMASTDNSGNTETCTACGKEGEENAGDLKFCNACKLVKYCSRECQIAHRPQHKKACKERAAELHDKALFKDPPPPEECPICCIPYPPGEATFYQCCGKLLCNGCVFGMMKQEAIRGKKRKELGICAYCRMPLQVSDKKKIKQLKQLMEKGNCEAFYQLGRHYKDGNHGLPQDMSKANELMLKAGELGCANAYYDLGVTYTKGHGVNVDMKKSKHYLELAAMNGHVLARYGLGRMEYLEAGNEHRAYKHFMIAAKSGYKLSLDLVKLGFTAGYITKDEYESALRAYHKSQADMKSQARDTVNDSRSFPSSSLQSNAATGR